MWTHSLLKCSLVVVLFACVFLAGSGNVSAGAHDGAGALQDAEDIPGVHDRHKGIRSYDSTGFPHDNNANRGVKPYGTPSGHGASHDHGIKGGGNGYNKNRDGCSKCKWENDDYWERDEPEEEGDENDGDECDDGQYRPDKSHHHGSGSGHKPGSYPSGVHKTGPTGVYVDADGAKGDGGRVGPLGGNYPTDTGDTRPISGYESTPKPGSGWNTPFAGASKPGYNDAGAFGTTPSSWPDWNRGTSGGSGSPPKPAWGGGHDGRFPSSQQPGASVPNFGATSKPGQGWNNQFPSGSSSAAPHRGSGTSSPSSYGNPQENQNKPYGQPGTQNTYAGAYAGTSVTSGIGSSYREPSNFGRKDHPFGLYKPVNTQTPYGTSVTPDIGSSYGEPSNIGRKDHPFGLYKPVNTQTSYGTSVTPGIGSSYGEPSNFGRKDHPFGLYKPVNTQTPHGPDGGADQASSNTEYYGLGGYNKPGPDSYSTRPTTVTNTFRTTKGPYGGIGSSRPVPGAQENPFAPGRSPGSPSGSGVYEHPGVTKPNYSGSTTSWLGAGQTGSGSSTWQSTRTTPHAGFPTLNTGFGTTKTPFSPVNIPSSALSPPYDRTRPKQPGFNVASSSATASAGASAFGTSPGAYSTPSITGTTSFYGTTPAYRGGSSYTPGVKGSPGSTRPAYGTAPHGTHPNIESGTWSGGQPGSSTGSWSSGKPEDGSGITPGRHSPGASGILPGKQPQGAGSGTWPTGLPANGSRPWPKQPGDGSGTWPGQVQLGHGSGPGCSGGNCGGATGPQEGSNCGGCCGNYNCDGGCSGRDNVPTTHGLCGGAAGPNEVNKVYNPAGTSDGNVPNIGTVYRPDPHLNTGAVYPGTQGASVTPGSSVPWNSANPFLYQPGGGILSSVSRPWTETTDKPIGQGNPFLDSSWSSPKPGYNNNDRNVIPHGEENTKPVGQGNFFLDGSNRRGDVGANPNEGVIPLEGKIPEGNNPFLKPLVGGSSGPGSPSYGKHPDKSGTPENFPGSGIPGSFPGSGTPGHYPGSGTPGSFPGSGTPGHYPGSGTPGSFPGSGTPGHYPGSGTPGSFPGSRTPGHYPGSGTPGSFPGSGTPGHYPGSGTPESFPGSRTPSGHYPGSGTSGSFPGSGTSDNYPGSGIPGSFPGSGTPGNNPRPGSFPGSGTPGSGGYRDVKGGFHPGGVPSQDRNSDRSYPTGSNPQGAGPLECKLGLFGCGTSGSGSYAGNKYPGGASGGIGGNVGAGTGNPGGVDNISGGSGYPGIGPVSGAGYPGSGGNNLAASVGGAQARAYAGSFSSAQASSPSFAGSYSGASGPANNFGGNLSPNGAQNQGGHNSWASSGASAFASSSAGSWSGNHPIDVKG